MRSTPAGMMNELRGAFADAMWSWAEVEGSLFLVYAMAIDAVRIDDIAPVQKSYFSIISPRSRLDMTNVAAQARWRKPEIDAWNVLAERCRAQLAVRGRIAHLSGQIIIPEKKHHKHFAVIAQHSMHPLAPADYKKAKAHGITADTLRGYEFTWKRLRDDIDDFFVPIAEARLKQISADGKEQPAASAPP